MSATCRRCGAFDPAGTVFRSERIPFCGARVYCPQCHTKLEENFLLGIQAINVGFGLIGFLCLWLNPSSTVGHVFANVFLVQLIILPSVIVHEFAHAVVGKLSGLTVLRIWIGRGKTLYRANLLGFDTEFKMIPIGGFTFLTHGFGEKLRLRYFLAIVAGPLTNSVILLAAWKFAVWRNFSLETSIQLATFIVLAQAVILFENLLPYRIQTALGRLTTDGLSLFQLLVFKSPEVLNSRLGIHIANTASQTQTWTE